MATAAKSPTAEQRQAFADYRAAQTKVVDPVAAPLAIVQREVLTTALKIRDYRRAGIDVGVRSYTAALFALLRVRRELREMAQ